MLLLKAIINVHLVYQDGQVSTGNLQCTIKIIWQLFSRIKKEGNTVQFFFNCLVYGTCKFFNSIRKFSEESQLYSM